MRITIEDLADWILINRRGRAFLNYTKENIMEEITEAWHSGTLVYHCEDEKILGVALGKRNDEERIIWIYDVLTVRPDIIEKFLERFLLVYPDYNLQGQRRGKLRVFEHPRKTFEKLVNRS